MQKIAHVAVVGLVLLCNVAVSRKMYPARTIYEDKKTGQYLKLSGPAASKVNVEIHPLPPWTGKEIVHLKASIMPTITVDSMLAYGQASINGKLVWVAEGGQDLCLQKLPFREQCPLTAYVFPLWLSSLRMQPSDNFHVFLPFWSRAECKIIMINGEVTQHLNYSVPLPVVYFLPGMYKGHASIKTLDSEANEILVAGLSFAIRVK